jgi:hypothetical protein
MKFIFNYLLEVLRRARIGAKTNISGKKTALIEIVLDTVLPITVAAAVCIFIFGFGDMVSDVASRVSAVGNHIAVNVYMKTTLAGLAIGAAGCMIVTMVLTDVIRQARAKYTLASYVANLSKSELRHFTWLVTRSNKLTPVRYLHSPPRLDEDTSLYEKELSEDELELVERLDDGFLSNGSTVVTEILADNSASWQTLVTFLQDGHSVGSAAADALFQRSRAGRAKYLQSVLALSRR